MHASNLTPQYWSRRIDEVTQDMMSSAHHQNGARDVEALKAYLQWLRFKLFKVSPLHYSLARTRR